MERRLNISWEKPKYPNSNTLNYTILIIDLSTNYELIKTIIEELKSLEIVSEKLGIQNHTFCVHVLLLNLYSDKGVPYNVTVFATNGRGSGPSVSEIVYAEEDSEFYYVFTTQYFY